LTFFENLKPSVAKKAVIVNPKKRIPREPRVSFGAVGSNNLRIKEANVNFDKSNQYLENSLN